MKRNLELRLSALEQKRERHQSPSEWVLADLTEEQIAAKLKWYKEIFQKREDLSPSA